MTTLQGVTSVVDTHAVMEVFSLTFPLPLPHFCLAVVLLVSPRFRRTLGLETDKMLPSEASSPNCAKPKLCQRRLRICKVHVGKPRTWDVTLSKPQSVTPHELRFRGVKN